MLWFFWEYVQLDIFDVLSDGIVSRWHMQMTADKGYVGTGHERASGCFPLL